MGKEVALSSSESIGRDYMRLSKVHPGFVESCRFCRDRRGSSVQIAHRTFLYTSLETPEMGIVRYFEGRSSAITPLRSGREVGRTGRLL